MRAGLIFIIVFSFLTSSHIIYAFVPPPILTENDAPIVRITAPLDKSKFKWNALVNYSISITDKEDGNSEYNEINGKEVLLKVAYLADSVRAKKYLAENINTNKNPAGLLLLMKSDCFTCHSAKNKLIGPSYERIAKRYPYNAASIELLTKKVMKGSVRVWGNTPMPAHPQIKKQQVKEMINWILKSSADRNISYYTGLEGAFRTREHPGKGVYVLTASYTDHGGKDMSKVKKRGMHTIVIEPLPAIK